VIRKMIKEGPLLRAFCECIEYLDGIRPGHYGEEGG
jgi:hypothetical protein